MAIDYNVFYTQKKGAAYKDEQIESYSHYNDPIEHGNGRLAGNSRIWGDASKETQKQVIDKIIAAAKQAGFNDRRLALLLATAKIESGFNPDAAAGTTSASSLGQFVKRTATYYGLDDSNRFDVDANVKALLAHFQDNEKLAAKKGKPDVWVYKYHHDGPSGDYGGEALATGKFAKIADVYEKALDVGHALTVVDPSGSPIADAFIKLVQGGKSAVLKTDEKGALPKIVANPEKGALTVYIQKITDEFKEIGQISLKEIGSSWTIIAPKQRVKVKTHLHQSDESADAPNTHKVKKGETLSGIARANGITYQELAKFNGIEKPYLLHPGQTLKMPGEAAPKAHAQATPTPTTAAAPAPAASHGNAANDHAAGTKPASPAPSQAPAAPAAKTGATATAAAPVVAEKRSAESKHPEAQVKKIDPADKIQATITYALAHKEPHSIHRCLRYVKHALVAGGLLSKYPGVEHAKDFGPVLQKEGFKNLLETAPGTNLSTAPVGSVIIYKPVEKQTHDGKVISGHIEIKYDKGYVSDFSTPIPTYQTDKVSLLSPINKKYEVKFQAIGIWYKDQ